MLGSLSHARVLKNLFALARELARADVFVSSTQSHDALFLSYRLSLARPIQPALNLTSQDTLKLVFTVFVRPDEAQSEAENIVPHQTFIRFFDPESGEEGISPVRVKSGGKAKFDLVRQLVITESSQRLTRVS